MKRCAMMLAWTLLVSACGTSDSPSSADPAADVSADVGAPDVSEPAPDPGPTPDHGDDGEVSGDAGGPPAPAPLAPPDDGVPVVIDEWMVAVIGQGVADPLGDLIDFDLLEYPEEGSDQGAWWSRVTPGEKGVITLNGLGSLWYGVTRLSLNEETALVVRADGVSSVIVGSVRQPGDVYHSRRHRVPLRLGAGEHLLVLRGSRRNNPPEVEITTTTHELVFNPADATRPELEAAAPHAQYFGLPVLNTTTQPVGPLTARVLASDRLEETAMTLASLAPGASSQVPFLLEPAPGLAADGEPFTATLRVEGPSLEWSYEVEVEVPTRGDGGGAVQRTFLSDMDGSVQFYGVREPPEIEEGKDYGLVLSLHGAGVQAKGQAGSYSPKDWAFVVAATNRRPFGFDWESFGRLDGLEVLNLAQSALPVDPTRVYLTGHSMGGHGTWQLGTLFPGRFAVIGPSAGWITFETYAGPNLPTGLFGWAALSSDTFRYATNLAKRGVYAIHGTADDNVPIGQMWTMLDILEPIVSDLHHHAEEGAGHWWDGDLAAGADCVDWPPLFELMADRTLDPTELDFVFTSAGPGVNPTHSFVTIRSASAPSDVCVVTSSSPDGTSVELVTENVRSLVLDGAALTARGVQTVSVLQETLDVTDGPMPVGPQTGKTPLANGPLVQVFQRPFCVVWADDAPPQFAAYAAYLVSGWNIIGNGTACAAPLSQLSDALRADHNIVYLGVPAADVPLPPDIGLDWDELSVRVDGQPIDSAGLAFVFPEGERLSAVITTTRTHEHLLYRIFPFNSRFWIPDWLVWTDGGASAAGFFDPEWTLNPAYMVP